SNVISQSCLLWMINEERRRRMIYLDNSATTKPDASVLHSYQQVAEKYFGNPSSIHQLGAEVDQLQMKAREQAAELLNIQPSEVIFTSGGTEGNNLALKGIALQFQSRGKHIVTTEVEHASVYETCKALENLGFEITYLPVNEKGVVRVEDVEAAIGPGTILVSIMQVNNEIGAVQPIEVIGKKLAQYPKLFFHVDAVQGLGKVPLSLLEASIDLCTFSGHKLDSLKGTVLFHGGGQEQSFRSGTENVAGNVSFVRALRLIQEKVSNERELLQNLKEQLRSKLSALEGVYVNSPADGAPHILNASVPGLKPEVVIHALYDKGAIISTQSACSSKRADKSRVLEACGLTESRVTSGLRMSLSYDTTEKEIQDFVALFTTVVQNLKAVMG